MSYNDFIWTNHALDRLKDRKIPKHLVVLAATNPDNIVFKENGAKEHQKKFEHQTIAAIVKENERGEKLIVSCWINPPNPGTKDFKKKNRYLAMQKAGLLKKLWLTFLDQVGL